MGPLLSANKLQFTRNDLLPYYSETQSPQFFTFFRSNGYRITVKPPQPKTDITQFLNKQLGKDGKQNKLKLLRKKVIETSVYPYSCIGLLIVNFIQKIIYGTGSLMGKNIILTAASNVYDKQTKSEAKQIRFILNLNQNKGDVFIVQTKVNFHSKFLQQAEGSHRYNYAILEIKGKQQQISSQKHQKTQYPKGMNDINKNPGLIFGYLGFNTQFVGNQFIYIFGYSKEYTEKGDLEYRMRSEKTDKLVCKHGALGYTMQSVPSQIGSPIFIRRLEFYQIVGIHISSRKELSSGLQFDENLRESINKWVRQPQGMLNLAECSLGEQTIEKIAMMEWHNMTSMNLNKNNLKCVGFRKITQKCWPMLRELSLSQNGIYKLQFDPSNIKNLQKLNLSKNSIKDLTILNQLPYLRNLDVSYNKIKSMNELLVMKYMQRLELSYNRINEIPVEIQNLSELKKLYLTKNELENLPAQIVRLKELIVLAIDKNKSTFIQNNIVLRLEQQNVEHTRFESLQS